LASTILNETGFRPDVIERQLAHAERNKVRAAYHRSEYLDERRKMMKWWGSYIETMSKDNNVVPLLCKLE
jgi:integrase